MDGQVTRKEQLLAMLAARTDSRGAAKQGFKANVASIRAELEQMEEAPNGN